MADLASTVRERAALIKSRPSPVDNMSTFGAEDQEKILRLIGLDPRDPKAHAVVAVARRYELDPVLGHIAIISTSKMPYITRDGYLAIAHRSGQLDGIEVLDGPERANAEWHTRVAVYRKDMSHPFIYPGRADVGRDNGPEMAIARAERRALRRAFAVTLPREFGDDEGTGDTAAPVGNPAGMLAPEPRRAEPEPPVEPRTAEPVAEVPLPPEPDPEPPGPEPIRSIDQRAIFASCQRLGLAVSGTRDKRLKLFADIVGHAVESTNDLTHMEARLVINRLQSMIDESDASNGEASQQEEGSTDAG
jgi:hypothetical protein